MTLSVRGWMRVESLSITWYFKTHAATATPTLAEKLSYRTVAMVLREDSTREFYNNETDVGQDLDPTDLRENTEF